MSVEALQNEDVLIKLKEELSSHIVFTKSEVEAELKKRNELTLLKCDKTNVRNIETDVEKKKIYADTSNPMQTPKMISKERMKRFLNMTPSDLPPPVPKKYSCEKDLRELGKPKDTIRCTCGILYERIRRPEHLKLCSKRTTEHKFGCASCSFKHRDMKEIEKHIENNHRERQIKPSI